MPAARRPSSGIAICGHWPCYGTAGVACNSSAFIDASISGSGHPGISLQEAHRLIPTAPPNEVLRKAKWPSSLEAASFAVYVGPPAGDLPYWEGSSTGGSCNATICPYVCKLLLARPSSATDTIVHWRPHDNLFCACSARPNHCK